MTCNTQYRIEHRKGGSTEKLTILNLEAITLNLNLNNKKLNLIPALKENLFLALIFKQDLVYQSHKTFKKSRFFPSPFFKNASCRKPTSL